MNEQKYTNNAAFVAMDDVISELFNISELNDTR